MMQLERAEEALVELRDRAPPETPAAPTFDNSASKGYLLVNETRTAPAVTAVIER